MRLFSLLNESKHTLLCSHKMKQKAIQLFCNFNLSNVNVKLFTKNKKYFYFIIPAI